MRLVVPADEDNWDPQPDLADLIESRTRDIGTASRDRVPRCGPPGRPSPQRENGYLRSVLNFQADEKTGKPEGSIQYEILRMG